MIDVSNDFKIKTKKIKQQDVKLTINSSESIVKDIHFMPVNAFNKLPMWMLRKKKQVIAKEIKYSFEGKLFKTIMKQVELTVKNASEIKDKNINFKYGIYVNNDYEYMDLGDFYIKDIEDSKSKDELTVTGYDKMIRFMKTFKQSELQLVYPCTLLTLILKMCEVCGVELYSTNFFNADLVVDEDYFTTQELTYRDVLEKITQSTLTTAFIKENKLYLCKIGNKVVDKLDKTYLTDLVIKEKFGPVNALVLGRGDVEDNIESKDNESISKNGRTEIRFDENELVEYKREKVIDSMFKQIKGLEYYSFEGADLGVMWLEPCDLIELSDREENTYKSIYLSANITINTGITSDIGANLIEETNTEYKVTTKEEKRTLRVERLAKKHEGLIQDIIEENTETSNKLTLHEQTIDSMKDTLKSQETKIETVETKANTAKTTADTATSLANTAQSTANTAKATANSAKTKADSNATKIQTTTTKLTEVEKTVDGITQSVSSVEEKVETVENTANTAKTSAENANSKIDNLQVGGRNFLTNTATEKSVNVNKASGYITFDPYLTNNKQTLAQLGLKAGDKVTISFNWKISKNGSLENVYGNFRLEWLGVNETSQNAYLGVIKNPAGTFSASNTAGKVTVTIALTATTVNTHTVRIRIDNSVLTFTVSNMKLEAGNMATDWTPAPEDIENNLTENYYTKTETNSQIQQKADNITTSVNKKITEIQVDADNLLLNTALKKDASNFSLAGGVTRVTDKLTPNNNYCFKYNISGLTADGWRSANPTTVELNAGEIVTASANVYIPSGVTNSNIKIEIQYFKADGTRITTSASAVDLTKTNTWQRVFITGTAPAGTVKANARVWILRNGQCWVGDLKLGRGNTVTSWCPSSKDYLTEKEARSLITQTADSINLEVSKKVGNDEIISKINQSAEEVQIDANKTSLKR